MIRKPMLAIGVAAAFTVVAGAAQAQTNYPTKSSPPPSHSKSSSAMKSQAKAPNLATEKFMKEAIQGDMAEVKMGQLAQEKGQSQSVKQFGKTLETDHGTNEQKAKDVAQSMGITPPTQLSAKQQKTYDKLSKLSGAAFDRQFAQAMVQDHKKDISDFEKEAKKSGPAAEFAQATLPTLRKHLQMAQSLESHKESSR